MGTFELFRKLLGGSARYLGRSNRDFTWTEIQRDWLLGEEITVSSKEVVTAFNQAKRVLGRECVETHESGRGTLPTFSIIDLGVKAGLLPEVGNSSKLIEKLKLHDQSALAELTSLLLLHKTGLKCEYEPALTVSGKQRYSDFKMRLNDEAWTHIEVTRPEKSELHKELQTQSEKLFALSSIEGRFFLDIYLRQGLTEDELTTLLGIARGICESRETMTADLGNLGILTYVANPTSPPAPPEFPEEPKLPMIGAMHTRVISGAPIRFINVRIVYSDNRAEQFLRDEARQLSKDGPGLIIVDMSRTPGGTKSWQQLLLKRLQPNMHTRVSGICMFRSSHQIPDGSITHRARLIKNPYAKFPLPTWIEESLARFPEQT